ncbi:M23 family metallopeptidase [Streptomyces sp. NPDC088261]|uniref:M23 family metallopeptidase n=1 Tax=Streptomyces sp. NPDC088261 TaxID=3365851 RepID=UPI0037F54AE7
MLLLTLTLLLSATSGAPPLAGGLAGCLPGCPVGGLHGGPAGGLRGGPAGGLPGGPAGALRDGPAGGLAGDPPGGLPGGPVTLAGAPGAVLPRPGAVWPVSPASVLRGWDPPATLYGPGHRGVDLAAAPGTAVRAAAAGRVLYAGQVAGRGVVSITLSRTGDPPLRITYEPVDPLVAKGDEVEAGEVVARRSWSSSPCAGCVHWGLRQGDRYLNPVSLLPPSALRRPPPRLLPTTG